MNTKVSMRDHSKVCQAAVIILISLFFLSISALAAPSLTVVKSVSVVPNSDGNAYQGSSLTSSFLITNTGDVNFDDVKVVDVRNYPYLAGSTDTIDIPTGLAAGASTTVYSTAPYVVTENDATYLPGLSNTATVTGYVSGVS
jgi:hypothetical protein